MSPSTKKAFQLYLDKQYEESMELLNNLLLDNSRCADCYRIKAYIFNKKNEFDLAETNYNLSIKYAPMDASFYLARASFYFEHSLFLDVIDDLTHVINNKEVKYRDISLSTAYFERSLAYCCLGSFDKVLDDSDKYEMPMRFMYMKPILGKINKSILTEYATKKKRLPLRE